MSEVLERPVTGSTALAVIPAATLPTILAADENDILGKLRAKVNAHKPDISTAKGRKEIASLAHEVATSKMDLIRLGKSLTEDWRKQTAAVNAECKIIEEKMDELKDRVRAPLTEFENREKARIQEHEMILGSIASLSVPFEDSTAEWIKGRLKELKARRYEDRDWQEFSARAETELANAYERLNRHLGAAQKREAEAAELERLRAEQAERDRQEAARLQAEREAQIAAVAAERARLEAERKAAEEAAAAERAAAAELARIEREAREAAESAQRERDRIAAEAKAAEERAAQAERDRLSAEHRAKEAAEKAEIDRIAAEKRAAEDAERREREAVEAERRRIAASAKAEADAAAARERDRAHRAKIMGEAKMTLIEHAGIDEATAVAVVKAIVAGKITNTRVEF